MLRDVQENKRNMKSPPEEIVGAEKDYENDVESSNSKSEDESISPNTKKKKTKRKVVFTEKEEAILRREKAKVPMTKGKDIACLLNRVVLN